MPQASSPGSIGLSTVRLERVYRFLDDAVHTRKIPSAAILIARHGVPLAPRAFGRLKPTSDSLSTQPDTIFLVASVTKPVTVSAAMLLVERGKLLLDDPVCSVIPEFDNHGKAAVQIRHLMTHTSGLPDMLPENQQLREQHAPLKEFIRRMCQLPLDFAPGTSIQYQSCGTAILGEIVERIEGISLPEFLRREFFQPLGMKDTALGLQQLDAGRVAHVNVGTAQDEKDWTWNKPYWQNFGAPWGGLFTTVGDMQRFCQMFLNGGESGGVRVFSPATISAMTADQTTSMPNILPQVKYGQVWGLGWRLQSARGWSYFGDLISPGAYGHGGATGTVVWIDPSRELICILFTTQPSASSEGLLGRCSNLVAAAAV